MNFLNLDPDTRALMLEEVKTDITAGKLYMSARFNSTGTRDYPGMITEACKTGDPRSLGTAIRDGGCLIAEEQATQRPAGS